MKCPGLVNIYREKKLVVTRNSGEVGMESDCLMSMGFPVGVIKKVLEPDSSNSCTTL